MCYHTALIAGPDELARRFNRKADRIVDFRPKTRFSAFAHAEYPIVTSDQQLLPFRWGLIPFWTRKANEIVTIRNQTVNARAETVFSHPAFRIPIRRKRCLVPVSGFYVWRQEQDRKIPYYVSVEGRSLFALAGIYDCWLNKSTNEIVATYSILTTEANETMRYVNNSSYRMPVIFTPEQEAAWLDPKLDDDRIAALLAAYPDRALSYEAVRNDFSRPSVEEAAVPVPA